MAHEYVDTEWNNSPTNVFDEDDFCRNQLMYKFSSQCEKRQNIESFIKVISEDKQLNWNFKSCFKVRLFQTIFYFKENSFIYLF